MMMIMMVEETMMPGVRGRGQGDTPTGVGVAMMMRRMRSISSQDTQEIDIMVSVVT